MVWTLASKLLYYVYAHTEAYMSSTSMHVYTHLHTRIHIHMQLNCTQMHMVVRSNTQCVTLCTGMFTIFLLSTSNPTHLHNTSTPLRSWCHETEHDSLHYSTRGWIGIQFMTYRQSLCVSSVTHSLYLITGDTLGGECPG